MEANIQSVATSPSTIFNMSKTSGLVSGSTQTGTATGGGTTYFVQSSVGSYMSGIDQQTTDGQYRVYSSVQGALVSGDNH